jgi:signal transduction histidine kinase
MKLALKLVVVCLVAMILITAVTSYFIAQREYRLVKEAQEANAQRVAGLIRESLELAYNSEGNPGIVKVIKTYTVDSGEVKYRWVWFDVSVSDVNRPSAPMPSLKKIMEGKMDSIVSEREGANELLTYCPLEVHDEATGKPRKGAVEVSGSLARAEQEAWDTTKKGLIAIVSMIVFCLAFIAWAGLRFIGRPLKLLTDQTKLIGEGIYDQPVRWHRNDEFGELAQALNSMSEKISKQRQQLRHVDQLKTVGRLAAGVAHEMGTPLNVISGRAGLMRSGKLTPQEMDESATAIQSEANRIAGIVRQLMDFARLNSPQKVSTDLRIVVDRTIELLRTIAEKNSVTMESSRSEQTPFTAFIDESRIQQVLTNIIMNAIQAMPAGGRVDVVLSNVDQVFSLPESADEFEASDTDAKHFVLIEIRDNGPGMDETMCDQIFEPFFTTKDAGQGTGLGLSIAHGIIEEHGGEITVESQLGAGTTFRIWLPKSNPALVTSVNNRNSSTEQTADE